MTGRSDGARRPVAATHRTVQSIESRRWLLTIPVWARTPRPRPTRPLPIRGSDDTRCSIPTSPLPFHSTSQAPAENDSSPSWRRASTSSCWPPSTGPSPTASRSCRTRGTRTTTWLCGLDEVTVDWERGTIERHGRRVSLSTTERRLLACLLDARRKHGRLRESLIASIWPRQREEHCPEWTGSICLLPTPEARCYRIGRGTRTLAAAAIDSSPRSQWRTKTPESLGETNARGNDSSQPVEILVPAQLFHA